jgi:hypothetical protein
MRKPFVAKKVVASAVPRRGELSFVTTPGWSPQNPKLSPALADWHSNFSVR